MSEAWRIDESEEVRGIEWRSIRGGKNGLCNMEV